MNEELKNHVCRHDLGNNKEYKDSKVQEKETEIVTYCVTVYTMCDQKRISLFQIAFGDGA